VEEQLSAWNLRRRSILLCAFFFAQDGKEMIYKFEKKATKRQDQTASPFKNKARRRSVRKWAATGVIALVSSFAFPLIIGLLVRSAGGIEHASDVLRTLSTISVVSIIPLLVLGSYCLNKAVELALPHPPVCSARQLTFASTRGRKNRDRNERERNEIATRRRHRGTRSITVMTGR
jgi:hypothetical protein